MAATTIFLNSLLDFFFPRFCLFCGESAEPVPGAVVCTSCQTQVRRLAPPFCRQCGAPFESCGASEDICRDCLAEPPPFARARAALYYEGPAQEAIHRLKYQRQMVFARPLKMWLAASPAGCELAAAADLLLPVPLHPQRLRQRGFNQSLLLAQAFPGRPLVRNLLERHRQTSPQVDLDGQARRENIRDAFGVRDPGAVAGKKVLVIDDVFTTGATVSECARVLLAAGAARVEVLTVARVGYATV